MVIRHPAATFYDRKWSNCLRKKCKKEKILQNFYIKPTFKNKGQRCLLATFKKSGVLDFMTTSSGICSRRYFRQLLRLEDILVQTSGK
jgi:hypothetical protein